MERKDILSSVCIARLGQHTRFQTRNFMHFRQAKGKVQMAEFIGKREGIGLTSHQARDCEFIKGSTHFMIQVTQFPCLKTVMIISDEIWQKVKIGIFG
jgi:hypothetical protein